MLVLAVALLASSPSPTDQERAAIAQIEAGLRQTGIRVRNAKGVPYYIEHEVLRRALRKRWNNAQRMALAEQLSAPCLSEEQITCSPMEWADDLMGSLDASPASLAFLVRLDTNGIYVAGMALEEVLGRELKGVYKKPTCTPPSNEEVDLARRELADFVTIASINGKLTAVQPTAEQLNDLAYFVAAAPEQAVVGTAVDDRGSAAGGWGQPAPPHAERSNLAAAIKTAKQAGNVQAAIALARAYLATLGYPGPLRGQDEADFSPGGARYSHVMRDLAVLDEVVGENDEAAALYRRATPGGGFCGTSVNYRWQEQVRGVIRTEERAGRCRNVVMERLLAIDGPEDEIYGPARLQKAGFDVARLYRGALVTANRDVGDTELKRLLSEAPPELSEPALHRFATHGAEPFEARVHAIEGFADTARRKALPVLTALVVDESPSTFRARAVSALKQLTARGYDGQCSDRGLFGGVVGGVIGGDWNREVRSLSDKEELSRAKRDELSSRLDPLLLHRDPTMRLIGVELLASIASLTSVPRLTRLKDDPFEDPNSYYQGENGERVPIYPVRDAVAKGLERLAEYCN